MERTRGSEGSSLFLFNEAEKRERQKRTAAIAAGSVAASVLGPLLNLPCSGREKGGEEEK